MMGFALVWENYFAKMVPGTDLVEGYLRRRLGNGEIRLKQSNNDENMAEVLIGDEFVGTLYQDTDEGEISFDFNMSIIKEDLVG
ncbi:DUF3126 family protein [Treponema primitia]|uniref:DUF3126 family protein n=1 Tax=Treponema primitia TaxID=88058 RepID=UPI00397F0CDC